MQITDNGLSSNQTMKILYEIDFPSDKFLWNEVGLASTDITGAPLFFSMANYSDVGGDFFAFGNFSLGELSSSMIDAGICDNIVANAWCVDYSTLQDNTTYVSDVFPFFIALCILIPFVLHYILQTN